MRWIILAVTLEILMFKFIGSIVDKLERKHTSGGTVNYAHNYMPELLRRYEGEAICERYPEQCGSCAFLLEAEQACYCTKAPQVVTKEEPYCRDYITVLHQEPGHRREWAWMSAEQKRYMKKKEETNE